MQYSRIPSYKDLLVWQKAMNAVIQIYELTCKFPQSERFGLTDQLRRAAVSIPSNISEGKQRNTRNEFKYFIGVAYGSIAEVETQLELVKRLKYCSEKECDDALMKLSEIARMCNGLLQALKKKPKEKTVSIN